jgi:invasion protein IalB
MQGLSKNVVRMLAAAVMAMTVGAAAAQQLSRSPASRPAPPAVQAQAVAATEEPQQTTATFADWVVTCASVAGRTPSKVCNMVQAQAMQVQGKTVPFSRVSVFYPGRGQPIKITVQVPVYASVTTPVHIQTADSDPGIVSPFARCLPAGCFADFELKDDISKKFAAAHGAGKVVFADASGRNIAIPLSFNGFTQALDALAKE